ncbi:MAG: hypothetical protein IJX85_04720 [Lachnospiraceae bacterium]|nr:hypothetical protein [Lachnospiraceae bacterium]
MEGFMKNIKNNNRGSMMIEAAIYFPLIILVVVSVIMLFLFKLDKIMTQANLSIKAKDVQQEMTLEEIHTYGYMQAMGDNSDLDGKRILKVTGSRSGMYQWGTGGDVYPVMEVDYTSSYMLDFMGLIPQTSSHGFLVKHSPFNTSISMRDVSLFSQVISGKIGVTYEDYMKRQYGY